MPAGSDTQQASTEPLNLQVEPLPAPESLPARAVGGEKRAPVAVAAAVQAGHESAALPSQQGETTVEPSPAGPEPAPSADTSWTFDPTSGKSGAPSAVIARGVQPQVREFGEHLAAGSTGGLAEALTARDVELGLGQGGQVLSAFEARARTMDVAVEGWAVFDVGIDSSGRVSVAVNDASTARDAWERLARTAVADVDAKRIHVPRGARGWRIAVRIEAKEQYPDGERPKDLGLHATTTGFKESKTSMVLESVPSVTLAARGKVCSAGVNWTFPSPLPTIAGGCNPENIGVREIRVVSGRIVDEGPL